jgi:hypothetical protein
VITYTAYDVFKNMCRKKRKMLAGEDYDLNSCKISKCGKNRLFVVSNCSGQIGNRRYVSLYIHSISGFYIAD